MSNITLRIGGRDYAVACAEGEEDHVRALGAVIDAKVEGMRGGAQSEVRQLLFAALLLADEVHEARSRQPQGNADTKTDPDAHAPAFEALAARLENIASALEG